MEYNVLDFSAGEDDSKFDGMFRKLIDGLELFYKGYVMANEELLSVINKNNNFSNAN